MIEDRIRDQPAALSSPDTDGMSRTELRTNVLFAHGASLKVAQELLAYNDTRFDHTAFHSGSRLALADELHVETWREYAAQAESDGVWNTLRRHLAQLSFPIRAGISQSEAYLAATRRGLGAAGMAEATGLALQAPQSLRLEIHPTPAGAIPLLHTGCREDFVAFIQALTKNNEPAALPGSLGAMLVMGYVNWDRIRRLREQWEREATGDTSERAWMEELRTQIKPHRHLYQDTFILLTDAPYSGVPAGALGLTEAEWRAISVRIRVAHETTHYLTRRLFGSARNNILDELLADYAGIVAGCGRYRADWFLHFMGLEDFPAYRDSGRLSYYRGQPPLSDAAFGLLHKLVKAAAENLEQFDREHGRATTSAEARVQLLAALTQLTLEELALPDAVSTIARAVKRET